MDVKINNWILSIPPHISTKWENILLISTKDHILKLTLAQGSIIEIPGLSEDTIKKIFATHRSFIDKEANEKIIQSAQKGPALSPPHHTLFGDNIFQIGFAAMDELGSVIQHNPSQAQMPDLPPIVLEKIATLAKAMAPEDISVMPKAVLGCNCMHCQISRAIEKELNEKSEDAQEEIVKDNELQFEQWVIESTGDNMFTVVNKLDPKESYSVFLGTPVGCTCGRENCEHIVAVLKS